MGGRSRLCGLIFVFILYENKVFGQVGSICRPNERFLSCGGCQPTCKDPVPVCAAVCKTGCYCNEGEVRNGTGDCVQLSDCPPIPSTFLHTTEPRPNTYCPDDKEEYRFCEPCNKTCENPNPVCPAQCASGCFCVDDLVRDDDGKCVKVEQCRNQKNESSNYLQPEYQLTCGPHQVYKRCQECEKTCSYPHPVCQRPCSAGCFCEEGYLKSPSGQCVRLEDCPRAEISMGEAELTVEDCRPDEVYLQCGWCEPSCSEPRPECPAGVCTRGCLCRPPLLRHHSGHCVEERECMPQKCADNNEEYVCRYGCEAKCVTQKCWLRPRRCVLGCHCKLGLFRDVTGRCVTRDKCTNVNVNFKTLPDPNFLPWMREANMTNNTFQNIFKFRDPYRKVNESVFKTHSNDDKAFFEVQSYVEMAPKIVEKNKKGYKDLNMENTPKSLQDVITLAKFYKEFESPSIYIGREIPIDIKTDSFSNLPIDLIDDREKVFKDIGIVKNYQIKEPENPENKHNMYEANVQLENSNIKNSEKGNLPAKDYNLNSYVNEILSAMKDIIPEQMNFTIVKYPTW